jgi:hypothetical protein
MGNLAEHLASHFVSAQIKHFSATGAESARRWIVDGGDSDAA